MRGFTLIEILLVLAIFGVLLVSSVIALGSLRGGSDLQAEARGLSRVLELARNRTIASEGDARYGVYATSTNPHRYILFRGDDYASRVVAEDKVYELRETIEFDSISFGGAVPEEVVFDRIQGTTSQAGNAVLRVKTDPSDTTTVYVESSGNVEIGSSNPPTGGECVSAGGDRVCDSRHMHIAYTRNPVINDTGTENIILNFDSGAKIETISIASNMAGGQIEWKGTVDVAGEDQTLKIHTHKFNDGFDSQFSVHRDRRFNTKPVTITLSDDGTGTLIEYDGAGTITPGTSIYVTATQEQ